jgi:hypothetical protein
MFDAQPGLSLHEVQSLALMAAVAVESHPGARAKGGSCRKAKPGAVTGLPQPHGATHACHLPRQCLLSLSTLQSFHPARPNLPRRRLDTGSSSFHRILENHTPGTAPPRRHPGHVARHSLLRTQ